MECVNAIRFLVAFKSGDVDVVDLEPVGWLISRLISPTGAGLLWEKNTVT